MLNVRDLPEDFTYTADIVSLIDGKKLGAQEWYGDIADWDSEAALAEIKAYYDALGSGTGVEDFSKASEAFVAIYPNPTNGLLNLESELELSSARFYDVTGRMLEHINLNGEFNRTLDISDFNKGIYILQVKTKSGKTSTSRFIKN
jgi:hypothetical protein